MTAASEAERYFEALYGTNPPGLIGLSFASRANGKLKFGSTECVSTAADAAASVLGVIDVYARIGLLREQPPHGRRGTEDLTLALPGLWAELDVNGGPDGRGGTVDDAFPTAEAAIEFARSAAPPPTMLVRSGYGVHAYWLFTELWMLGSKQARKEAKDLEREWLAALHRRVKAQGIGKLDHVFDLARVLRPPGSANGKDTQPAPVKLLDADGPRYTVEQIRRHIEPEPEPVSEPEPEPEPDLEPEPNVARLLEAFPVLDQLARHKAPKGKEPKDTSPSGWDMFLAIRAAGLGANDAEVAELIRHSRRLPGDEGDKGEREDYISRTVAKARERVGYPAHQNSPAANLDELTKATRADEIGMRVTGATVVGKGGQARAILHLTGSRGDYDVPFARFSDVTTPARLSSELALTLGVEVGFSVPQAIRFGARMRSVAARDWEDDEAGLALDMAHELLCRAEVVEFDTGDQASRWAMWKRLQDHHPGEVVVDKGVVAPRDADIYADRVIVARDRDGNGWLRTAWAQSYLHRRNPKWVATTVHPMLVAGRWGYPNSQGKVKATDPDTGGTISLSFYIVPNGWER